jgi:glycosyltransferase involved in cell wall biosynthesis
VRLLALCADRGIRLDAVKGATIHLTELWRALARAGVEVTAIAPSRTRAPAFDHSGVTIHPIPVGQMHEDEPNGAADLAALVLAAASEAVARGPAPDAVLERLALGSEAGLVLARCLQLPLVVEINAPLDEEARRFRGYDAPPEMLERQRRLLAGADVVYVVSDRLVSYASARGARPERVRVLPNGVDARAFAGPHVAADLGAPVRVGFVGTFKAWHGLELVIQAYALARERGARLELALVGDGPLRPALEADVMARGLADQVHFYGARPHGDIAAFLSAVDVAIAAAPENLDYYFSPLKVYEYAAAGCTILAPRVGQIESRFHHGEDAYLVPPGDAVAMADALVLLAGDGALRARLGEAARARARVEFDWSAVAATILGWIQELRAARAEQP